MAITEEQIRRRAHQMWEAEGRPEGRAEEHWRAAEAEIRGTADKDKMTRPDLGTNIQVVEGGGDLQSESGRAQTTAWPHNH